MNDPLQNYPPSEWCAAQKERIDFPKLRTAPLHQLAPAYLASCLSGRKEIMNVFRMMLHGKQTFLGFMLALNGRLNRKTALPPKEKERLILFVTCKLGCTYEYTYHYRRARAAGNSAEEAKRASTGEKNGADERERLAYAAAEALLKTRTLPEDLLAAMKKCYSDREIFELIEIVGSYDMVAMIDNALEIPIEDGMWLTEGDLKT